MRHNTIRIMHTATIPNTLYSFTKGQLAFLRNKGFEVIAVSSPGPLLEQVGEKEGVKVHGIPMTRRITPLKDLLSLIRMTVFLRRLKPHIVQAGTPKATVCTMVAASFTRVPVRLVILHGAGFSADRIHGSLLKKRAVAVMTRISCLLAHRVICVSSSVRGETVHCNICKSDKLTVLHNGSANGIDFHRFSPEQVEDLEAEELRSALGISRDAKIVLFAGRLVADKGIVELSGAWKNLRERFPAACLVLAGRKEPEDPVPRKVWNQLDNDLRVILPGYVDNMAPLYRTSSVFVLPSHREGFPYVPMEAAAMELPVVATRVTGCVDAVVDGVTGTLVPPHDPKALASAISTYLHDPELARQHGKAGRERVVRDFRQEDVWRALYEEYVRLLKEKGLPVPIPRDDNA